MRTVPGEPTMIMSDQQARLSGRKRGRRPLERSVVGDLLDLLSEPNPLPQSKAPVATATHTVLIALVGRRDGYCLIVFFQKLDLVIVNTVQFSTHCDQI
jgi:hypothetical protein